MVVPLGSTCLCPLGSTWLNPLGSTWLFLQGVHGCVLWDMVVSFREYFVVSSGITWLYPLGSE